MEEIPPEGIESFFTPPGGDVHPQHLRRGRRREPLLAPVKNPYAGCSHSGRAGGRAGSAADADVDGSDAVDVLPAAAEVTTARRTALSSGPGAPETTAEVTATVAEAAAAGEGAAGLASAEAAVAETFSAPAAAEAAGAGSHGSQPDPPAAAPVWRCHTRPPFGPRT